jgi:hypothetical protein
MVGDGLKDEREKRTPLKEKAFRIIRLVVVYTG